MRKCAPPFFVGAAGMRITAASGRRSEMSEWPRSKFQAFAVRQRRNLGRRNRAIGPYGGFTRGVIGRGIPYTHTLRIYTHKILAKFAARRRQKIQITFHCDMCVEEKYLSDSQCGILPLRGKIMRAADRKPLWQKILREFLPVKKETPEGVSFCCKYIDRLYLICQPGPYWPQPFP